MKIAVITRHAISNYGSILQAYATQEIIRQLGYEVEIIDYIRSDEDYKNIVNVLLEKNPKWNKNFVMRWIYRMCQSPTYILAGKKFEKMRKKFLYLTCHYCCEKDLHDNIPKSDVYMTGSDQVWGPVGDKEYDPVYFLNFVEKNKVSYAASFGKTEFTDSIQLEYGKLLSEYTHIAARETSAVGIIEKLIGEDITQVLDPTLLISREQWSKLIQKDIKKKYVLIYQLHRNKEMDQYAKAFAAHVNLPLIRITPSFHHIIRGGRPVFLPDLGDFLSYIKNATYMITDSFHGTAFAINFGTQFIEILPNNKTGTRNQSILELTGLSHRIITNLDDFNIADEVIDFEPVHAIIEEERAKSIYWLSQAIKKE